MIPYKVIFLTDEKTKNKIHFESNEKPVKGEIFTIQNADETLWEAKITEVTKVVIRTKTQEASLEYRCKVEKHDASGNVAIGFGKRI